MSQTILQINFKFDMPSEAYIEMARPAAEPIANFPGFVWKVWLMNEDEREAGGLYLFESAEAAQVYLESPIVAKLASRPQVTAISVKTFSSIDELTEITHGPVRKTLTAL